MAAVEVDGIVGEAELREEGQGLFAFCETERSVEAGESDVRVVRAGFGVLRGEAAAGHVGGYGCLEMEKRAGGLDFCDEDACSWEGVQAGESYLKRREVKFGELVFDGREAGFGNLSQEDESEVEVFGRGAAAFGELDCLGATREGLG